MPDVTEAAWLESAFATLKATADAAAGAAGAAGAATGGPGGAIGRLEAQIRFLLTLDRAKSVLRRTYITDGTRLENDAEHMWHVTLAALVLAEQADEPVDAGRLACMLAVHDIVEIDAGDTFVYDTAGSVDKLERETRAAERIFGLLPPDQASAMRQLWDEFEERSTPTAKMAAAIDRLLPLLMNRAVNGRTWSEHGVEAPRVLAVNSVIESGSANLWAFARLVLEGAVADGTLAGSLPEPAPATPSPPRAGAPAEPAP